MLDLTNPTVSHTSNNSVSLFEGQLLPYSVVTIVAAVLNVVFVFIGKKTNNWVVWGILAAIAGLVALFALRMVFYLLGVTDYNFSRVSG